jgi:hypothetical protein
MPDIKIHRDHSLGLAKARKVAWQWAEEVEKNFDMECTVVEGEYSDTVQFKRSGPAHAAALRARAPDAICDAISADYGHRSRHETLLAEIVPVIDGIDTHQAPEGLDGPQRRPVDRLSFPGAATA